MQNKQQREKYIKTNETQQLVAVAILKEFREAKLKGHFRAEAAVVDKTASRYLESNGF